MNFCSMPHLIGVLSIEISEEALIMSRTKRRCFSFALLSGFLGRLLLVLGQFLALGSGWAVTLVCLLGLAFGLEAGIGLVVVPRKIRKAE